MQFFTNNKKISHLFLYPLIKCDMCHTHTLWLAFPLNPFYFCVTIIGACNAKNRERALMQTKPSFYSKWLYIFHRFTPFFVFKKNIHILLEVQLYARKGIICDCVVYIETHTFDITLWKRAHMWGYVIIKCEIINCTLHTCELARCTHKGVRYCAQQINKIAKIPKFHNIFSKKITIICNNVPRAAQMFRI